MSTTLDKKELLKVLDQMDQMYCVKHHRVTAIIRGLMIDIERGQFDTKEPAPLKPITTKPALDKEDLLATLKLWEEDFADSPKNREGYSRVIRLIEHGDYDLGVTYAKEPAE